jgi:hypothetical protein
MEHEDYAAVLQRAFPGAVSDADFVGLMIRGANQQDYVRPGELYAVVRGQRVGITVPTPMRSA